MGLGGNHVVEQADATGRAGAPRNVSKRNGKKTHPVRQDEDLGSPGLYFPRRLYPGKWINGVEGYAGFRADGFILRCDILGFARKQERRVLSFEVPGLYFMTFSQLSGNRRIELGNTTPEGVEA